MSQYFPKNAWRGTKGLDRVVSGDEYARVLEAFYLYGFHRGWVQDLESHKIYRPYFENKHPFE